MILMTSFANHQYTRLYHKPENCVSLTHDFVAVEGRPNTQGSNFKYFYLIDKKTYYKMNQNFLQRFRFFFSSISRSSIKLSLYQTAFKQNTCILYRLSHKVCCRSIILIAFYHTFYELAANFMALESMI